MRLAEPVLKNLPGGVIMGEDQVLWKLDFGEKRRELIRFLESTDNAIMALATSQEDRVLARTILVVCSGLEIYFFTWEHSRKCDQIRANPRVALCRDRYQIEGVAEILGGLFDEKNKAILEMFMSKFPKAIENWKDNPGMILVRIKPTEAVIAGEPDEEPQLKFLDLEKEVAHAEKWAYY